MDSFLEGLPFEYKLLKKLNFENQMNCFELETLTEAEIGFEPKMR